MQKLVVATKNPGKLKEVKALLANYPFAVLSLADFPELPEIAETGLTFMANAQIKALAIAEHTGLMSLGDDSGLEVDFLEGAPGVYSARFAGENANDQQNNQKLLSLLAGVPPEQRTARFRCVMALVIPGDSQVYFTEGTCPGLIGEEPVGEQGFGYDPLFILPQKGLTLAQLDLETKNQLSHRAQALKKAVALLLAASRETPGVAADVRVK